MKYKKITVRRLYHGFASVRDYQVEEARAKKVGLAIHIRNRDAVAQVPFESLDRCFKENEILKSIYHGDKHPYYTLWDYDFEEFKVQSSVQFDIFSSSRALRL